MFRCGTTWAMPNGRISVRWRAAMGQLDLATSPLRWINRRRPSPTSSGVSGTSGASMSDPTGRLGSETSCAPMWCWASWPPNLDTPSEGGRYHPSAARDQRSFGAMPLCLAPRPGASCALNTPAGIARADRQHAHRRPAALWVPKMWSGALTRHDALRPRSLWVVERHAAADSSTNTGKPPDQPRQGFGHPQAPVPSCRRPSPDSWRVEFRGCRCSRWGKAARLGVGQRRSSSRVSQRGSRGGRLRCPRP